MRNHFAAIPSGCKLRAAFAKRYGKQLMLEDDVPFGQPLAQAAQTQDSSQRPVSEFSDDPLPDELDTSGLDFNSTLRALIDLRGMLRGSFPKTGDELVQARAARLRDECGARRAEECLAFALRMNDLDLVTAIGLVFPAERTAALAASYDDI